MRSCNCLNIEIETEGNDFEKVIHESLNLTEDEKNDSFFKQDIQRVRKLININKVISGLIQTKIVGSWTIDRCINCNTETHAVHKDKGASCVLIFAKLIKTDAITKLRSSGLVSCIYNIVINPNDIDSDDNSTETYLPPEIQQTIKNISQVSSEVLRKESQAVEDRIRKYKEEQYDMLNTLKDKAFKEQQSLVRVIRSAARQPSDSTTYFSSRLITEIPRLTQPLSPVKNVQNEDSSVLLNSKHTPKRQKSTPITQTTSFDSEGLFDFEGVEGAKSIPSSDLEESDKEEREDGIKINRGRCGSISIAKSLPVNIPAFLSQARFPEHDDFEEILPQNPMEIAANIQALAKSVHGDAVFGDLPRPRFSTQY